MGSAGVVVGQEGGQPSRPLGTVGITPDVGPSTQTGLYETLSLAIGLRPIGACKGVLDAQRLAGLIKQPGAISAPVIGQHALDTHAQRGIVGDSGLEEGHCGRLLLIGMHLDKACPGVIVNGDARHFPAGTFGSRAFRLDKPNVASTRLIVATLPPTLRAMRRMGMRPRRNCSIRCRSSASTVLRVLCGRELRSASPAGRSVTKHWRHLRAVRTLVPAASAAGTSP